MTGTPRYSEDISMSRMSYVSCSEIKTLCSASFTKISLQCKKETGGELYALKLTIEFLYKREFRNYENKL